MSYKVDTIALKKLMVENGYDTIESLAEAANVNRNTVSDVVSGKKRPSTKVIERLMVALHIEERNAGKIFFVPNLRNT